MIEDYLSKNNTNCLKIIFAICVFMHHLYQYSGIFRNTVIGMGFNALGYLSVSIFFFLSGYGLQKSLKKNKNYLNNFIRNRIIPFYITYLAFLVLYILFNILLNNEITLKNVILSLTFGYTYVKFGWFFQVILFLYFLFYINNKINHKYKYLFYIIVMIIYSILLFFLKIPSTYYETIFSFILGVFWVDHTKMIDSFFSNNYYKSLILFLLLFIICLLFGNGIFKVSKICAIIFKIISSLFFTILVLLFIMKVRINYNFVTKFSGYYLPIYVSQGFVLLFLRSVLLSIDNIYIYIFLSIIFTFLISWIINFYINFVNKFCNKYIRKE